MLFSPSYLNVAGLHSCILYRLSKFKIPRHVQLLRACLHEKRGPLGVGAPYLVGLKIPEFYMKSFARWGRPPPRVKSKQLKERSLNSEAHDTKKDGGSTEYHGCERNYHFSFIFSGRFSVMRIIIDVFITVLRYSCCKVLIFCFILE